MPSVRESLLRTLNSIAYLPTMPRVLFELEEAMRDYNTAADRLGRIIRRDPALTASVLRVANSAVYRGKLSKRISSVPLAIVRLGYTEVRRICMSTAIIRAFDGYGSGINHPAFWRHCVTVASVTRIFDKYTSKPGLLSSDELEDAFVAGLLHDVGMLVMEQFFPELFARSQAVAEEKLVPLARAELDALGIHHGEIGGALLRNWSLAERVSGAVTWHHDPDQSDPGHRRVTQLVHLADFICVNQSIGDTVEGLYDGFSVGAWYDLGLSVEQVPNMLEDLKTESDRSEIMGEAEAA